MSVIPFSLFHYDVIVMQPIFIRSSVSEMYCDSHGKLTKELTYEENLTPWRLWRACSIVWWHVLYPLLLHIVFVSVIYVYIYLYMGLSMWYFIFIYARKYTVCEVCWLRSSPFQFNSVLYITPTHTWISPAFDVKHTWHVESNYILQFPKYLITIFNRNRYINNNIPKYKWSMSMDMTMVLVPHEFSLQATIDHHEPYMFSGHYTTSINCCKKYIATTTNYGVWNYSYASSAYIVLYKLIM